MGLPIINSSLLCELEKISFGEKEKYVQQRREQLKLKNPNLERIIFELANENPKIGTEMLYAMLFLCEIFEKQEAIDQEERFLEMLERMMDELP